MLVFLVFKNISEKKAASTDSNITTIQEPVQNENRLKEVPTIVPDSASVVEEEKVPQDSSTAVKSEQMKEEEFASGEPIYYLVGGSFESEENALTYMK